MGMSVATTVLRRTYSPSPIHAFYAWLDRLPLPAWLLFLLLLPGIGLAQHIVAWRKGALGPGQFSFDLGTAGYWLVGILLIGLYVLKAPPRALDEYRPYLNVTEDEYARLKYEFLTIPSGTGSVLFLVGVMLGAALGFSDMTVAPAIDYIIPQLRLGIWMLTTGITFLFLYQVIRQLQQIRAFYAMPETIDLFNPRPLYGFPRYTAALGIMIFLYEGLAPLILDPTAFETRLVLIGNIALTPFILLMFYLPLAAIHGRLVSEKERLLAEADARIAAILDRIHSAAFENQGYAEAVGMRAVFSTLVEEKHTIEGLRTWPWQPGTLSGLLSALVLPTILVLIREIIVMILDS